MKKTLMRLNVPGMAVLAVLLSFPVWAGTTLPVSFRQNVEQSSLVAVGTVALAADQQGEIGVWLTETINGDTTLSLIFIAGAPSPLLSGANVLLLLGPARTAIKQINGITQIVSVYDVGADGLFNLDAPGNEGLRDAAYQYVQIAAIPDPEERTKALVAASIASLSENNPALLSGAALDLQTIPEVYNYLGASDQEAIAASVARTHNGSYYKRDLLDAAGAARSLQSADAIIFSLTRPNSANIREAAGRNLAYIDFPQSEDHLLRQMRDPRNNDPETQVSLAHVLGTIKSIEAVPSLMAKAAIGNARDVRVESILALGEIQDQRALPVLNQCLADPDPVIVRASLQALAWLDNSQGFDLLRNFESTAGDPRMKLLAHMLLKVPNRTISIYE